MTEPRKTWPPPIDPDAAVKLSGQGVSEMTGGEQSNPRPVCSRHNCFMVPAPNQWDVALGQSSSSGLGTEWRCPIPKCDVYAWTGTKEEHEARHATNIEGLLT